MAKRATIDLVTQLGELALATRLKRLGGQLQRDVSLIYRELALDFEARWFVVIQGLGQQSPQTVTELARSAGLSHQAVGQIVRTLIKQGLVRDTGDRRDERRRLLRLTAAGRRLSDRLVPIWEQIGAANAELLDEVDSQLLKDLARLEAALDERSMAERVRARIDLPPVSRLRIVDYRPAYKKHFQALNEHWLKDLFTLEDHDIELLADPNGRIIKKGGAVLFARLDGEIVGTAALLRHRAPAPHKPPVWELAKMAVIPDRQRRGIGQSLAEAVIERTRTEGANHLYLQTSPQLAAACRLYRRFGFRQIKRHPLPFADYCRCSLIMRLDLDRYHSPTPRRSLMTEAT